MEPLKNRYNKAFIKELIDALLFYYPALDESKFQKSIFNKEWETMELKERMHHIAITMNACIPEDYETQIDVLKKASKTLAHYNFEQMFFPDFVETFGIDEINYETSVEALAHFTQYSSSEFAVRPFIKKYEKKMMAQMMTWATHENHHVRRLATEGCRPRLPWAMALPKFKKNPTSILLILEILKNDSSEYVRRSVANNLNDIAKDNPETVLEIAEKWINKTKEVNWIVKHGCRTLLKKGNTRAMLLFGFGNPEAIDINDLWVSKKQLTIGDTFDFSFEIKNNNAKTTKLRLEYFINYQKANNKHSKKIFQITEKEYSGNTSFEIKRKQHFKNLTTRKHYPGTHQIIIVVNGVEKASLDFELLAE